MIHMSYTVMIKVGDIVELQPTNNRNRQLRSQESKHIWEVVKIDTPQCFNGDVGFLILHQSGHERWVQADEISIIRYTENRNEQW
jgi:hypothetical protein